MVNVIIQENTVLFEVQGLHKLWAFKSRIIVQKCNIIQASRYTGSYFLGLRFPGTYLPGVITAGTYYANKSCTFCDVCNKKKAIEIVLENEKYAKLIIEVADVEVALKSLNAVIEERQVGLTS